MKNKLLGIVLMVTLLFMTTGCTNTIKLKSKFESSGYHNTTLKFNCEEVADAVYYEYDDFITSTGKVYRANVSRLFSNDKNCIESSYQNPAVAFAYGRFLYDSNRKPIAKWNWDKQDFVSYDTEDDLLVATDLENSDFDYISINDCEDSEQIYIKDNKIYKENYDKEDLYLGEIPSDETIIYMDGALIKTNKNFYSLIETNEEECHKYVDVKCQYAFECGFCFG